MEALLARLRPLLDDNGYSRVVSFSQYPPGWDGDGALSMSEKSLEQLVDFLRHNQDEFSGKSVSVFMDNVGLLSLAWRPQDGNDLIEVSFDGTRILF